MPASRAVIMDCEYFACREWFAAYTQHPEALIEQHEYFVRKSYRNRCYVAGPNGVVSLSVPLKGGRNQKTILKDVKISNDEDWQAQHWKTLVSCYGRSVYFEYYADALHAYFNKTFDYLVDANIASLELLLKLLQLNSRVMLTENYQKDVDMDLRNAFLPAERSLSDLPTYIQPFSDRNGFEPNLSMLDYLFCCGRWG